MPASCSANGCQNRQDKRRPDLAFKTIPTDKRLNELWKSKIKRKSYPKDHNIVLCWEHFSAECFERDFASEFKHKSTKELYKIKDDAVPTIFSYRSSTSPRLSSKNRSVIAAKRKMVSDLCDRPSSSSSIVPNSTSEDSTLSYSHEDIGMNEIEVDADLSSAEFPVTFYDKPIAKMTDVAVNTDLSFAPFSEIIFDV